MMRREGKEEAEYRSASLQRQVMMSGQSWSQVS